MSLDSIDDEQEVDDLKPAAKESIAWRLMMLGDWVFHLLVVSFHRTLETLEAVGHWALGFLEFVASPHLWLPRKPAAPSEDDGAEALESDVGFWERVEGIAFTVPHYLLWLVTPWHWFRQPPERQMLEDGALETTEEIKPEGTHLFDIFEGIVAATFTLIGLALVWVARRTFPWGLLEKARQARYRRAALAVEEMDLSDEMAEAASRVEKSVIPPQLFRPVYVLVDASIDVIDFLSEWWFSRDFRQLVRSAPAVMLTLGAGGALCAGLLYSQPEKIKHYQLALYEAREADDDRMVALVLDKLRQLGDFRLERRIEDLEFEAAIKLAADGDVDAAFEKMKLLATPDEAGYFPAHVWIAGAVLDGKVTVSDDDIPAVDDTSEAVSDSPKWRLLRAHLDRAGEITDEHPLVQRFQVELALHEGNMARAAQLMESNIKHFPDLHATLASTYRELGELSRARFHAQRALQHFQDLNEDAPGEVIEGQDTTNIAREGKLTPLGYLRLAEANALIDDSESELQLLKEGVETYPDNPQLKIVIERVLAKHILQADLADPMAQRNVEYLFRINGTHPDLIRSLVKEYVGGRQTAKQFVVQLDEDNLLPGKFYNTVGDYYMIRQQYPAALKYYRKTLKLDQQAKFAWNNVAWILGNIEPIDIEQAMTAASRAVDISDNDPRLLDTRGQILAKLQRWEEAIEDLERALTGSVENRLEAHATLVICYKAIGKFEQANAHQQLVAPAN